MEQTDQNKKSIENTNTNNGVNFRGGGGNVPPIPKMFCSYEYLIVLVSCEEIKDKAPLETKPSILYNLILLK